MGKIDDFLSSQNTIIRNLALNYVLYSIPSTMQCCCLISNTRHTTIPPIWTQYLRICMGSENIWGAQHHREKCVSFGSMLTICSRRCCSKCYGTRENHFTKKNMRVNCCFLMQTAWSISDLSVLCITGCPVSLWWSISIYIHMKSSICYTNTNVFKRPLPYIISWPDGRAHVYVAEDSNVPHMTRKTHYSLIEYWMRPGVDVIDLILKVLLISKNSTTTSDWLTA